jgi:glycine/D-amino acid oxidase-like deaminating enzyme
MDLRSGYAFWPIQNGLIASYPPLNRDITCEVAIIGGGITGALIAYKLAEANIDTVLLDKRDVSAGSTSASTGLLQYEVDTPLVDLSEMIGKENAERSYRLCLEAIGQIEDVVKQLGVDCAFARKKSLYVASHERDAGALRREYEARQAMGIDLDLLECKDIRARFSFDYPAALLSQVAAEVDPYRLAHALLRDAFEKGMCIYDRTAVTDYKTHGDQVMLHTDRDTTVTARHVVFATGYESQSYLKQQVTKFRSTYAFVTEPIDDFPGWGEDQCLLWETARPYFYARTTNDRRMIVGGADDAFDSETRRERRLPKKTQKLMDRVHALFPDLRFEVAYAWAGTFGETEDGLPYIGAAPEFPNGYFALGYGGNGITYSMIAADILRDAILGRPNPDATLFRFDRYRA